MCWIILSYFLVWLSPNFLNPISQADFKYISSPFGWRIHPISGKLDFHNGIDIATHSKQAKVYATAAGKVVQVKQGAKAGLSILIDHGNGYSSFYAHLSRVYAKAFQELRAGELIGQVGSTGNATGTHLHFEIRWLGGAVDPIKYQECN